MLKDSILEKLNSAEEDNIWGKYDHMYGWSWNEKDLKPTIYPISEKDTKMTGAVLIRDWTIAQKLSDLNIKKVLDIGSDTGHLMATLKSFGIDSVGIDPNKKSCDYINSKGVNNCYNLSIQDLIKLDKIDDGYDCLVCLNITHVKWENEKLKEEFIDWASNRFKYCVLSNITNQDKKWNKLDLIYSFNMGRFKYNKIIQYFYKILGIDQIPHYLGIQKVYKSKNL